MKPTKNKVGRMLAGKRGFNGRWMGIREEKETRMLKVPDIYIKNMKE